MLILLLGHNGQLGWELHRTLLPLGEVMALDYPEIDLSLPDSVCQIVRDTNPQVIVNAAAYTAVDRAESEPDVAMAVNGHAPGLLAEMAFSLGAALIHYSTDYVFDGYKGSLYTEADSPKPLNEYGQSKLAGEQAISQVDGAYITLRTSWVYSLRSDSFVTKVLGWARQNEILRIVSDQIANPTWARALAEITALFLARGGDDIAGWIKERRGIYHLAGTGHTSRYQWAQAILRFDPRSEEQIARQIQPALTAEFPTPAKRPLYSALNCDRFTHTFGLKLPEWEYTLRLAMQSK